MIEDTTLDLSVTITKTEENLEKTNKFDPVKAWARYLILETAFLDYLRYVPFTHDNYNIISPILDDLLIRICSFLESFWKSGAENNFLELCHNPVNLKKIREKPKQAKIGDLEAVFNTLLRLNKEEIHYIHEKYQHSYVPFKDWSRDNPPDWWTKYNELKHKGFEHSITFEGVRNAIGGLFLAIVTHIDMFHYLESISVLNGVHKGTGWWYANDLILNYPNFLESTSEEAIYAKSTLFGYIYYLPEHRRGKEKEEYIKRLFTPPYDPYRDYKAEKDWVIWARDKRQRKVD